MFEREFVGVEAGDAMAVIYAALAPEALPRGGEMSGKVSGKVSTRYKVRAGPPPKPLSN